MGLTTDERVHALMDFRFTDRQARFLELVLRHAGVCVPRQYANFSGIANGGRRCNAFFDRLVGRGYASEISCVHNRARLFHLGHKALYHVIGEGTSRYRRRVSARLAVERLMLLDAVLAMPTVDWLTTAKEKAACLSKLAAAGADAPPEQPARTSSAATRQLRSTLPIGLEPDGRAVLLYLATEPWTDGFRSFLQEHAALLRVAPTWTLRLVFPRPLDRFYDAYQTVIREELESPLHPATVGELKWYFEHRRAEGPVHPQTQAFLDIGQKAFGTARFTQMYRRWLKIGNAVFEGQSPTIAEALTEGRGGVESIVLPHSYRHLVPLASDAPAHPQPVESGLRKARPQRPPVESTLTVTEGLERDWHRLNEHYKAQRMLRVTP